MAVRSDIMHDDSVQRNYISLAVSSELFQSSEFSTITSDVILIRDSGHGPLDKFQWMSLNSQAYKKWKGRGPDMSPPPVIFWKYENWWMIGIIPNINNKSYSVIKRLFVYTQNILNQSLKPLNVSFVNEFSGCSHPSEKRPCSTYVWSRWSPVMGQGRAGFPIRPT
jgi:hypothetical protein